MVSLMNAAVMLPFQDKPNAARAQLDQRPTTARCPRLVRFAASDSTCRKKLVPVEPRASRVNGFPRNRACRRTARRRVVGRTGPMGRVTHCPDGPAQEKPNAAAWFGGAELAWGASSGGRQLPFASTRSRNHFCAQSVRARRVADAEETFNQTAQAPPARLATPALRREFLPPTAGHTTPGGAVGACLLRG